VPLSSMVAHRPGVDGVQSSSFRTSVNEFVTWFDQSTPLSLPLPASQDHHFRPLNLLLTEPTAPELLFMETKWASLVSYGLTAQALKDFLPMDATLNATTIQHHALVVAQRCEDELGDEQWAFVEVLSN
jgi:hypothetical protein